MVLSVGSFMDPVFEPLLSLDPFLVIIISSFFLALLITFIYKWMTDQEEMKELKKQTKEYQKKMKKLMKEDPEKMKKVQQEAMKVNSKYMTKSMRPTLVTFIPVIIILGWIQGNLAYEPIGPGEDFDVEAEFDTTGNALLQVPEGLALQGENNKTIEDGKVMWEVKAVDKGTYTINVNHKGRNLTHEVIVSDKQGDYAEPVKGFEDATVEVVHEVVRPMGEFSIFGWQPNWLWTYIIFSMIFSISLRKLMGIQ
ncbi:MAG: EMC3/TMCO1 family protein [Nanobdellota archaeon]